MDAVANTTHFSFIIRSANTTNVSFLSQFCQDSEDIIADVVKNVEWQMSLDRKTGALKTLQGLVWAKGYEDGSIKGQ